MLNIIPMVNEIVIQPVQVEMKTPSRANERINIGFTDRPLNAQSQIRNIYLDGVRMAKLQNIPDTTPTKITGFTAKTTGNLRFFDATNSTITIPKGGTYQIIFSVSGIATSTPLGAVLGIDVYKNGVLMDGIETEILPMPFILTSGFDQGDVVEFYIYQYTGGVLIILSNITMTRLS